MRSGGGKKTGSNKTEWGWLDRSIGRMVYSSRRTWGEEKTGRGLGAAWLMFTVAGSTPALPPSTQASVLSSAA